MRRKTTSLNSKSLPNDQIKIVRSGKGSFDLVKKHRSKGIFYYEDSESGKVFLVENINSYKESEFSNFESFSKYIDEVYS